MCGFVGTVGRRPLADHVVAATRGLAGLMARRGPDDEGHLVDPHVALGFRRLSVLDLSAAGHQPMESPDRRWALVFNGEVYNHPELRAALTAEGVRFRSTSDTEVVLWALIRWGTDALIRFDGMFALALVDRAERSVLLARDPMGIKPLYWLDHAEGLVFASQYDAVVRHPWCERQRLRADVAALYLRFGYVPSPYGIVEGTGQVPAGSTLRWTAAAGAVTHTFAPWPDAAPPLLRGEAAQERVHRAVQDSVRRQLVADVPVGTFLSGGIDSPLVTAVGRQELDRPIPSFTIGSDHPAFDEADQARIYAEHLGVQHTLRTITEADALALYDDVIDAYGEPFGDYSAFPTMLVSRLAREQVTVALSGDGGDELFMGYPRMWTVLRWRRLFHLPPLARRVVRKALTPRPAWRPPEGATFPTIGAMVENIHTVLGGGGLGRVAPGLGSPPADFDLYRLDDVPDEADLAQWLRRNEVLGHLEKMLVKVDRASMHESLEIRVPLLDRDLVEAAVAVDPAACMAPGLGKLPLRRELARHVPAADISAPKMGFGVPLGDWLRAGLADRFTDRVVEHPVVLGDAFDAGGIRALVAEHRAGADHTQPLWNLLSLQEWADRHLRPLPAGSGA